MVLKGISDRVQLLLNALDLGIDLVNFGLDLLFSGFDFVVELNVLRTLFDFLSDLPAFALMLSR